MSLTATPADVIDRCATCRRTYREGDLFCDHVAAQRGYAIARLPVPSLPSAAGSGAAAFTPVFLAPSA